MFLSNYKQRQETSHTSKSSTLILIQRLNIGLLWRSEVKAHKWDEIVGIEPHNVVDL